MDNFYLSSESNKKKEHSSESDAWGKIVTAKFFVAEGAAGVMLSVIALLVMDAYPTASGSLFTKALIYWQSNADLSHGV